MAEDGYLKDTVISDPEIGFDTEISDNQGFSAEQILAAMLESAPENVILVSTEHKVIAFNSGFKNFLKVFTGKDLKSGDDFRSFIREEVNSLYTNSFNRALEGHTVTTFNESEAGNQKVWFEYQLSPVYLKAGNIIGVTILGRNIDRQRKEEIELENMAENYEAIIQNASETIILLDPNFKVLRFNKVGRDRILKNLGKELYLGADFREFVYPAKMDVFLKLFHDALQGITHEEEVRTFSKDNDVIWFLSKMYPVFKRNGELLGITVFASDIKARKEAEVALLESEQKFRFILESVPLPIIILNKDMNIVLTNPETEHVFGFTQQELVGFPVQKLIPESCSNKEISLIKKYIEDPADQQRSIKGLVTCLQKEGKEIATEIRLNSFMIKEEQFFLMIVEDVTDRLAAEKKISDQLKRLEAIAWQQSHEVRRPVANILGIIEMLKTQSATEEERNESLSYLYQMTESLDSIIQKIVDYASLVHGKSE
jgi:PAS domain S-box-containing protein